MNEDAQFEYAVNVVLEHEGGYVNDPKDPGGATQWGISLRFLKQLGHEVGDLDGDGDIDVDDIRSMTREQAVAIYRERFWDKYRYGEIDDLALATKVFDLAVNMGSNRAHRLLQRALHAVGQRDVVVDGILGSKTRKAANAACPGALLAALRSEAAGYYRSLVLRDPTVRRFLAAG